MNTSWVNGLIENNKRVNFFLVINCILITLLAYQSNDLSKLDIVTMIVSEFIVWFVTFFDEIKYKHISVYHKLLKTMAMAGMPIEKENLMTCVMEAKNYNPINIIGAVIYILPLTNNVLLESLNIKSATGMALTYFTILEIIYISFIYIHWFYLCSKYKSFIIKGE